jgi:hypothetical protein
MKRLFLLAGLFLATPLRVFADQPVITSFGNNGEIVWTNDTSAGYCTVEWAASVTGTWARSWQGLFDLPSDIGETRLQVPMFYRVAWSPTSSVVNLPSLPQPTDFIAAGGANYVGLSWTVPANTNVAGVSIARDEIWYPDTIQAGTLVYSGVGNSTVDSQVTEGTKYYYKAFTYDRNGNYSFGVSATATPLDTVAPPNVSSFTAQAGDHLVNLGWRNPASADFAGVRLVRTTGSPPTGPGVGSLVYAGLGTNITDSGLNNGTFYYYKAYSFDAAPNYSIGTAASALPLNTLPPGNVTGIAAIAGDERITLSWINPTGGDFVGVRVQRKVGAAPSNPADGTTVYAGNATGLTNLALVNGTEYFYRLYSYDEVPNYAGGVATSAIPADVTPPGSISNLVIVPVLGNISIRWANPADADLAGARVLRKATGYPTNATDGILVYQGFGTNTGDTALSDGVDTNYYRVYAFDEVPNYAVGVTGLFVRPRPVTNVRAVAGDELAILSWTNPVTGNFSGVRIQRTAGVAPSNAFDGLTVYEGLGTSFTNVGLANNTQFFYSLFAFDALPHFSSAVTTSAVPADVTAPSAVSSFTVSAVPGGIGLSWANPSDTDLAGVRIQRKPTGYPTNVTDGITVFQGAATNAMDTSIADGVATNFYRAFAFDEVPNYSTGMNGLLARQPNVTGLTATSGDQKTTLTWTNPGGAGFAGVRIQRDIGRTPTNTLDGTNVFEGMASSFTNAGLVNLSAYRYSIYTFDATPNYSTGASTTGTPADVTAPASVTAFAVAPVSGGIGLSWVNPADADLAGVRVLRKTTGYPSNTTDGITVFDGSGTNAIDSPLTDGTGTNFYRAFAYDEVPLFSPGVNVVFARPQNVTAISAASVTGGVTVSWVLPASTFAGVRVQRSTTGSPATFTDGVTVYDGIGTNVIDGPLVEGIVSNYYRVFTFDQTPHYSTGVAGVFGRPQNVVGLVAVAGDESVTFNWTRPAGNYGGVRIQRCLGRFPTNAFDGVTAYNANGTSVVDSGLSNTVEYYYAAFSFDATPHFSAGIATSSVPLDTFPPANASAINYSISNQTVFLQWQNPTTPDFAGVRIQRKTGGLPTSYLDGDTVFSGLATNFTDTGLSNAVTYYYRILAYDEIPNYASGATLTVMPLRRTLFDDFEDSSGWINHDSYSAWTEVADSGTWNNDYAWSAVSYSAFAHSGVRYLQSASGTSGYLYLPPVDYPVRLIFWARLAPGQSNCPLYVEYYAGSTWYRVPTVSVTSETYNQLSVYLNLSAQQAQRLRFYYSGGIFIDDVEVWGK